ncbi:hypothetical protein ACWEOD_06720, partial [Micrococcus luteus]
PPTEDYPVRIEFFGDEVEQMRWFSGPPCGGRRAAVVVVPARGRCPVDQAFAAI